MVDERSGAVSAGHPHPTRVAENAKAADLVLDSADLAALDKAFPPPRGAKPLAML